MSTKRIEQLIEDIYEFVESCKPTGFKSNKVAVPKDELYDLLDELRLKVPDEIKRCQKMIANRDAIMADAQDKASALQEEAKSRAQVLINDNEIVQQAYYQANEIMQQATAQADELIANAQQQADEICYGALNYTNDMLTEMERMLTVTYEETRSRSESLVESLRRNLEIVTSNRMELCGEEPMPQNYEMPQEAPQEGEYNFEENAFLQNIE